MAGVIIFSFSIFALSGTIFVNKVGAQEKNTGASPTIERNAGVSPTPIRNTGTTQNTNNTTNNTAPTSGGLVTLKSPLKKITIDELLGLAVRLVVRIGTVLSVLALMYVGLQFILARGNDTKITAAKEHLWYVVIGIAVLFGATLIVQIIKVTLSPFVDTTNLGAKP